MRLMTIGLAVTVLGLASCDKDKPATEVQALAAMNGGVEAAADALQDEAQDWPVNPEDGDLVGTELHGDMAPVASGEAHPRNLPALYPAAYALWQSYVARTNHDDRGWVDSLESTSTPLSFVTVNGQTFVKGWVCEMHNCGGNELVFLMSPDQTRMIGYLRLVVEGSGDVERVIGPIKPAELECLRFFMDDTTQAESCG